MTEANKLISHRQKLEQKLRSYNKFKKLYNSAEQMGAASILRQYIGICGDLALPLSISHGVDMNHCKTAMDIDSIEPIHWSYNKSIHMRTSKIKESVQIPHPWLLLSAFSTEIPKGRGVLVIGPPPSKRNDERLLVAMKEHGYSDFDVLIKQRGNTESSREFWSRMGVGVRTAGDSDERFYRRLFDIIGGYEIIVAGTLSSAIFFASTMGKKCRLLEGYRYESYETENFLNIVDFTTPSARHFLLLIRNIQDEEAREYAKDLLGWGINCSPLDCLTELLRAIERNDIPLHHGHKSTRAGAKIAAAVALKLGRKGLIRHGIVGMLKQHLINRVSMISIDEIDVWLNGINSKNFSCKRIPYRKGITEPGWAPDDYRPPQ
jgi:hypothetical protein